MRPRKKQPPKETVTGLAIRQGAIPKAIRISRTEALDPLKVAGACLLIAIPLGLLFGTSGFFWAGESLKGAFTVGTIGFVSGCIALGVFLLLARGHVVEKASFPDPLPPPTKASRISPTTKPGQWASYPPLARAFLRHLCSQPDRALTVAELTPARKGFSRADRERLLAILANLDKTATPEGSQTPQLTEAAKAEMREWAGKRTEEMPFGVLPDYLLDALREEEK